MKTITMEGTCDLHIHSAPDIVERIGTDLEIALKAKEAGMRAIVYKCVLEPTVSRAWHTMQSVPGLQVYGGIVLDHHVGGINLAAVEPALQMGGKVVWLPTYHALGHQMAFGKIGSFGYVEENPRAYELEPIGILDGEKNLKKDVIALIELCQEHEVILATGHISTEETLVLARKAHSMGFKRLVVNHPFFKVPGMDTDTIGELVKLGAYLEFCANELCPIPGSAKLSDYVECVNRYGVSNFILASDAGHNRKGWPVEELRIFAQLLGYSGIREDQLKLMMKDNYEFLLGLS